MRTVQLTLEEDLVTAVDRIASQRRQSRSAFTRDALRAALAKLEAQALEQQHREGYLRQPVSPGEFSDFLEQLMTTISAAEANRHFSQVLRQVARGETLIITSRGKPMATIAPITRQAGRSLAQRQLLERLASQPPAGDCSWTRAELYED